MCTQFTSLWSMLECHLTMYLEHIFTSVRVHVVEKLYTMGWWGAYTTTNELVGKAVILTTSCRGTWAFLGDTYVTPIIRCLVWWPVIKTRKVLCDVHMFWYELIYSGLYEMMQGVAFSIIYMVQRTELKPVSSDTN